MKKIAIGALVFSLGLALSASLASASGFYFYGFSLGESTTIHQKGLQVGFGTSEASIGSVTCSDLGTISVTDWNTWHSVVFTNYKTNGSYACTVTAQDQLGEVITSPTQYVSNGKH